MTTTVAHLGDVKYAVDPRAVDIMRPTVWGNPFVIGRHGSRRVVIEKYEQWLRAQPEMVAAAKKYLRGKVLLCCCSPRPCHGDVLARVAEEP